MSTECTSAALPDPATTMMRICAIDIGGTKIAGALFDRDHQAIAEATIATRTPEGGPAIAEQVIALVAALQEQSNSRATALGIAAGGQIDAAGDIVDGTDMIPHWVGYPLRATVAAQTDLPTVVLNDGHAAALAESQLGAGRGQPSMLCVVVGTGIGGGLVIDGHLQHGHHGLAGSVGQLKVTQDGRRYRPLEKIVSGPALVAAYNARVPDRAQVTSGQTIAERANAGDDIATSVVAELGGWLGLGLSHALHAYDAACVVVGGSVAQLGEPFFRAVRQGLHEHGHASVATTPIRAAVLGPKAGLFGAALFAQQIVSLGGKWQEAG